MKKILYLLSGNISTTPRALQSISTAKQFYEVDVLGVNRNTIWAKIDKSLLDVKSINYETISLSRKPFISWFLSSLIHIISQKICWVFPNSIKLKAYASSKTSYLLNQKLKSYSKDYHLVVAHSYSSLFPAYQYSKNNNTPFIFDIEDYHPGEEIINGNIDEVKRREYLMKMILPKASYLTYASPLIGKNCLKLLKNFPSIKHALINNCFSKLDFQFKEKDSNKIDFVWFSQNISANRGLEMTIPLLYKYKSKINIVLIGNLYKDFFDSFLSQYMDVLTLVPPMPQHDLHKKLADFDIGLALELKNSDINKNIALSNKIFAYAQSGLYILASDTEAQSGFIKQNSVLGNIFHSNLQSLEKSIEFILDNIVEIRGEKIIRFNYAQSLSWENESEKLIDIWENLLS